MRNQFDVNFPGLQINWIDDDELEFIGRACLLGTANHTAAKCTYGRRSIQYLYPVKAQRHQRTLTLKYESNPKNWDRRGWDVIQGTLTIIFKDLDSTEPVSVTWWHKGDDEKFDLEKGLQWKFIPEEVQPASVLTRGRLSVSRLDRLEQQKLRNWLITEYSECLITRTKTISALEACHIVPVKNGGSDVPGNALLLRRDLHALFDAGLLNFQVEQGDYRVRVDPQVSDDIYRELDGLSLGWDRMKRHKVFLEKRAGLPRQVGASPASPE